MARKRLAFRTWPAAVYAIGDVHGCLDQLVSLQAQIIKDGTRIEGEKWIIMLGDYVDRGPNSAGVIKWLRKPLPKGWKRICLAGNHELMFLEFLNAPNLYWLDIGGMATLTSYGIEVNAEVLNMRSATSLIPAADLKFLKSLPLYVSLPGWLFVHAGIRPGVALSKQSEDDLTFIRGPFLEATALGKQRVVHGHTPVRAPEITPTRIGIDTHCFWSGQLTALRVLPSGETKFLAAKG